MDPKFIRPINDPKLDKRILEQHYLDRPENNRLEQKDASVLLTRFPNSYFGFNFVEHTFWI